MRVQAPKQRLVRLTDEAKLDAQYREFSDVIGVVQSTTNLRRVGETKLYAWVVFGSRMTLIPMDMLNAVSGDDSDGQAR